MAMGYSAVQDLASSAATILGRAQDHHAEHENHIRKLDIAAVNAVVERIEFEKGFIHGVPLSI
jgi:hypothetical protein